MSGIKARGRSFSVMPNWRLEDEALDPFELRVAAWLASHVDGWTEDHVSLNVIAERTHVSKAKVSAIIPRLAELGIIEVETGSNRRLVVTVDLTVWQEGPSGRPTNTECSPHEHLAAPCLPIGERQGEPPTRPPSTAVARRQVMVDAENARVDALFEAFWRLYPRHEGKPAARRAFGRVVKLNTDLHEVGAGLRVWIAYWTERNEPQFIPHPSTWLNQQRWNDAPPAASAPKQTAMQRARARHARVDVIDVGMDPG